MCTPPELFATVGIPVPLAHGFSYAVPAALSAQVKPGVRVMCEFGRRKVVGIVLEVGVSAPEIAREKIKPIRAVLDSEATLPEELLTFLQKLAAYYFAPIGEVLRLALPALERDAVRLLERQGQLLPGEGLGRGRQVGGRKISYVRASDALEKPGSLRGQAAAILALLRATGEQSIAQLQQRHGNARKAVKKLQDLGLVETEIRAAPRRFLFDEVPERDEPPELTAAQLSAVERIEVSLDPEAAVAESAFLLFGVTGSGKTEVYMRLIAQCLERQRGALILVPEIALTPQLLGRFRARFGNEVAVLHSALSDSDRHDMWKRLRCGELKVAVGARSALFAPVLDLGLVVVDEEHDSSFKQEEGVRYHARDMALLRAHRAGATVVLGSATPSLEAMALVRRHKLVELRLPERATQAELPQVEIVDLKRIGAGPSGDRMLSLPLHRAIEKTLAAEQQAIIFLNRRGFAPAVICDGCGVLLSCKLCSVALTYHRGRGGRLRCHYCDYAAPLPERCPECHTGELMLEGLGTEKLQRTIAESFPNARIGRLDRDVGGGTRSHRILEKMRARELDILVGTQMVTKGHDLPKVTLVGVVNADAALSMPDFRAAERGFQLLVQVAGRAGRHGDSGLVVVQTRKPRHPAIRCAARHDVMAFHEVEWRERCDARYPPFWRLALVRVNAKSESLARQASADVAARARAMAEVQHQGVEVLGPAAAPIARLRERYRFRVMLRAEERAPLRRVLARLAADLGGLDRKIRAVIDVDPVSML